ncbi:sialate:O-sulfotransferase 1-like [Saccoglossus kowalevskii]
MRHLIEQTTGIYSGSLGNSSFMLENGFLGELESRTSGRTVVTKTHGINFKKINMFDKVILIFRNPYRCFLAEFNRQQTGSKTERALATSFNSKAWQSFIHRQFSRWEVFAKNWLTSNLPKLVVHYEDLEDNLIHELRRISRFLNVTSFESRLSCVMKNTEGRFHRTTGNTNHVRINPYTPEMRDRIDDLISKTDKLLQSKGFSPLHKNVNKTIFL